MRYLPTGMQMRKADLFTIEHIGIPSMVLMERAALSVLEVLEKLDLDLSRVLVVCGSGNNGGDGYALARLLHLKGMFVQVLFAGREESRSTDNQAQKKIADFYGVSEVTDLPDQEYTVIVDAIFGTGLKRPVEGSYYQLISQLNARKGTKISIDIPSGINDTTGEVMGIGFAADVTVAIAYEKRGLALYPGAEYAGQIVIGSIGITDEALKSQGEHSFTWGFEMEDFQAQFPKRFSNSHKGSYGKILMIVGSSGMSGAAYLSAKAAYEVGAGLVHIYTAEDNRVILQKLLPEAVITTYRDYDEGELLALLDWADVVGIGSGLGKSSCALQITEFTIRNAAGPLVIDADSLNLMAEHRELLELLGPNAVLTPHMKEMGRLLNISVKDLSRERIPLLEQFVLNYPVVCALKDARTLVAKAGKNLYLNLSGNEAMAKAGTGDVLMGTIAGILGQKADPFSAACLGVYLHGLGGDRAKEEKGSYSVLASDVIEGIGQVLKNL